VLLSGDASHAREVAQQNLQKSKWSFEENKNRRSRDIRERQQHVKIRKQMIKKHERIDEERRKALSTADDFSDSIASPVPIGGRNSQQQIADQERRISKSIKNGRPITIARATDPGSRKDQVWFAWLLKKHQNHRQPT